MVVLDFRRTDEAGSVTVDGRPLNRAAIDLTGNASWRVTDDAARYFAGPKLGDYVVATSGMTTGNNDLFVRPIAEGAIVEPYRFEFFADPISLENERRRARLGALSSRRSPSWSGRARRVAICGLCGAPRRSRSSCRTRTTGPTIKP
jgi:hypothetical protein